MSGLRLFRIVVLSLVSSHSEAKGLLLCGVLEALEVYGPDTICCNYKTYPKVDVDHRKRDCCVNLLYYSDEYECVNGKLQSLTPPIKSPSAPTRRKKKEPKIRMARIHFQMKNNSDQHIRATIERLNREEKSMTKHEHFWKD
ncbi:hypothetical protein ACJMK2_029394 [Sinanodonta woodiana]|uniref:Uncharacterized protein n=1 Tax=Sinanodonta woodiana TaxID=1069815 RepID=A0ABD3XA15_SINWO